MPSRADLDALRAALERISGSAKADLMRVLATVDRTDVRELQARLAEMWPELVGTYGEMAGVVAADLFESWAYDLSLRPKVVHVAAVDVPRANARMRWGTVQTDVAGNLVVLLDELVKQPARSLIQKSAIASGGGWARVPTGAETCAFCLMLASRGGVYSSARTAGRDRKYHGDCDCMPTLVRNPTDYPAGYDPNALYDVYDIGRGRAGNGNTKDILSEIRTVTGSH
jgi:hypothetical protein